MVGFTVHWTDIRDGIRGSLAEIDAGIWQSRMRDGNGLAGMLNTTVYTAIHDIKRAVATYQSYIEGSFQNSIISGFPGLHLTPTEVKQGG